MRYCPLATDRGCVSPRRSRRGDAKTPWFWNTVADPKLNSGQLLGDQWLAVCLGSYWQYSDVGAGWESKFFQKEGITRPTDTPTFTMQSARCPAANHRPASFNLFTGPSNPSSVPGLAGLHQSPSLDESHDCGQTAGAGCDQHGLSADGHASNWKPQKIKDLTWHSSFIPNANCGRRVRNQKR